MLFHLKLPFPNPISRGIDTIPYDQRLSMRFHAWKRDTYGFHAFFLLVMITQSKGTPIVKNDDFPCFLPVFSTMFEFDQFTYLSLNFKLVIKYTPFISDHISLFASRLAVFEKSRKLESVWSLFSTDVQTTDHILDAFTIITSFRNVRIFPQIGVLRYLVFGSFVNLENFSTLPALGLV